MERHPAEWTYNPESGITRVTLNGTGLPGDATAMVTVSSVIGFHLDADGKIVGFEFHADLGQVEELARLSDEEDET